MGKSQSKSTNELSPYAAGDGAQGTHKERRNVMKVFTFGFVGGGMRGKKKMKF